MRASSSVHAFSSVRALRRPLTAALALALTGGTALTVAGSSTPASAASARASVRVSSLDGFPSRGRLVLNALTSRAGLVPHSSVRVRVANLGRARLTVSASASVTLPAAAVYGSDTSPAAGSFRVTGVPRGGIAPGRSALLTVTYSALAKADSAYTRDAGTLTIRTNDPSHPRVHLAISGLREYEGGHREPELAQLLTSFGWSTRTVSARSAYRFKPVGRSATHVREVAAFGPVGSSLDLRAAGGSTARILTRRGASSSTVAPLTASGARSMGVVPGSASFRVLARIQVPGERTTRNAGTWGSTAARWQVRQILGARGVPLAHTYVLCLDEPNPVGQAAPNGDYQDEVLLLTGADLVS